MSKLKGFRSNQSTRQSFIQPIPPSETEATRQRVERASQNKMTRLEAEGFASPPPRSDKPTVWDAGMSILDRPRNALFTGLRNADPGQALSQVLPALNDLATGNAANIGARIANLLGGTEKSRSATLRGLAGEETYRGADAVREIAPEWAEKNPGLTQLVGTQADIVGDPLTWIGTGGTALSKTAGQAVGKTFLAALSPTPEVALAAQSILPQLRYAPALAPLQNLFAKGASNTDFAKDLRGFRAGKDFAKENVIEEGRRVLGNATPQQEVAARQTLENMSELLGRNRLTPKKFKLQPNEATVANAERQFSLTDETAMERMRRLAAENTEKRAAGGGVTPSGVRNPYSPSTGQALEQQLTMAGVDPEVARLAATTDDNFYDWIRREYQKEGLPLSLLEDYAVHIPEGEGPLQKLTGLLKKRPVVTKDRFNQMRKFRGSVEEANEQLGRKFFRDDLIVPAMVRKLHAVNVLESRRFLKQTLSKYGAAADDVVGGLPENYSWVSPESGAILKNQDATRVGAVALPDDIARAIDGITGPARNPDESIRQLQDVGNWFRRAWGANVTIYRPAFHANNFMGGTVNNHLGGVRGIAPYKVAKDVLENKAGSISTPQYGTISYAEGREALRRTGTLNTGLSGTLEESLAREVESGLGRQSSFLKNPGLAYDERARQLGKAVENELRSTLFIDRLKKGATYEEAADAVIDFHFDYSREGLDPIGRVVKPWMPFLVFTRNNLELQATQFFNQPGTYTGYNRIREGLAGDSEDRPEYMKRGIALGEVGDREVVWNARDPIFESVEWIDAPFDTPWQFAKEAPLKALASQFGPQVKAPAELIFNQSSFTGAPIKKFEGETTPILGGLQVDPYTAHGLRSLTGVLGTVERNLTEAVQEGKLGTKQAASLGGIVIPGLGSYDPEQTAINQAYERDRQLADALKAAEQKLGRPIRTLAELEAASKPQTQPRRANSKLKGFSR
jgi:hypothetical protein